MPGTTNLLQIVSHYHPLLERYARRLTRDARAAPAIVKLALEQYYENRDRIPEEYLRKQLKQYCLVLCRFWCSHRKQQSLIPTDKA